VTPATTQLPRIRTPCLEYLEIMHNRTAIHPVLGQVDRHWPNMARRIISFEKYSKSQENTSKDFPTDEFLPNPQGPDLYLPVVHQSVALQELQLHFGDMMRRPQFTLTRFPELRALHCSLSIFRLIDAPKLEELHFLWPGRLEVLHLGSPPLGEWVQTMLRGITTLNLYSHLNPTFHEDPPPGEIEVGEWMLCLHSLQTLILGWYFAAVSDLIGCLWSNPTLCPKLTTIDSFTYPQRWSSLWDCIEKWNHLAMRDPLVHPIRTLRFPVALHRNISDWLKESLSGEFAGPFIAVPLQPCALEELIQPDDEVEQCPEASCPDCIRSGNVFECLRPGMKDPNWSYYIRQTPEPQHRLGSDDHCIQHAAFRIFGRRVSLGVPAKYV